jgi:hypothetical protein
VGAFTGNVTSDSPGASRSVALVFPGVVLASHWMPAIGW